MATTIHVPGPCLIQWSPTLAGALSTLGYSDAQTLPSITFTDHAEGVTTTMNGAATAAYVNTGLSASVSVTLIKWDDAEMESLLTHHRGVAASQYAASVGRFTQDHASGLIVLGVIPVITGRTGFKFYRAHLVESQTHNGWGNDTRTVSLTWHIVPEEGVRESIICEEITT